MADKTTDEDDLDKEPTPLPKMTCTSTKCEENLHCFLPKKPRRKKERPKGRSVQLELFDNTPALPAPGEGGSCRSCGRLLVDWTRIHRRDLSDAAYTVEMLKTELWRQLYWSRPIDPWAVNRARRRGHCGLRGEAEKRIRKRLAPANPELKFIQTPPDKNIVYYAQHGTGTCCRKCLKYWHGIDHCRDMTEDEITYARGLIQLYIAQRLPALLEQGEEKVPSILKRKMATQG